MNIPRSQFRHVDNLLGIHPEDKVAEAQAQEAAKDLERSINQWAAEVNVLQEFQRSEAWTLLKASLEEHTIVVRNALAGCTEPTTMAKGVGALLILEGFQKWPEDRVRDLLNNLEQAKQTRPA